MVPVNREPRGPIYLDIETIPSPWETVEEAVAFQQEHREKSVERFHARGLDPLTQRIICVGAAHHDDDVVVMGPHYDAAYGCELDVLDDLSHWLRMYRPPRKFVGHNVFGFDLPCLWVRASWWAEYHRKLWREGDRSQTTLDRGKSFGRLVAMVGEALVAKPWDKQKFFDTLVHWPRPRGQRGSLDHIAEGMGLGKKIGHGSKIHQMWIDGDFPKIADHCRRDVELVRRVHQVMVRGGLDV